MLNNKVSAIDLCKQKAIIDHFIELANHSLQEVATCTLSDSNFHFSHYKYMETLSCHSNESTLATTIKNILYVEANVKNINAKFQLHPPYDF